MVPVAFAGFVDGIIMEEMGTSRWAAVGGGGGGGGVVVAIV